MVAPIDMMSRNNDTSLPLTIVAFSLDDTVGRARVARQGGDLDQERDFAH